MHVAEGRPTPAFAPSSLRACVCVCQFVFKRMDGKLEDILVRLLEKDAAHALKARLAAFDASQARCFLDQDRQKMLAVIEATFGTMEPFNQYCRNMFQTTIDRSLARLPVPVAQASPQQHELEVTDLADDSAHAPKRQE